MLSYGLVEFDGTEDIVPLFRQLAEWLEEVKATGYNVVMVQYDYNDDYNYSHLYVFHRGLEEKKEG